jgi:hypothetical protein
MVLDLFGYLLDFHLQGEFLQANYMVFKNLYCYLIKT